MATRILLVLICVLSLGQHVALNGSSSLEGLDSNVGCTVLYGSLSWYKIVWFFSRIGMVQNLFHAWTLSLLSFLFSKVNVMRDEHDNDGGLETIKDARRWISNSLKFEGIYNQKGTVCKCSDASL